MTLCLIAHVYNEALLMPFFVRHYRPLVDRAVIVDYASTDETVSIVRRLAPQWEVRPSRNPDFAADACDREIMAIERELDADEPGCWKVCMNATEFLLAADLRATCERHARAGDGAFAVSPLVGVDRPSERPKPLDQDRSLWRQVGYGFVDEALGVRRGRRFVHRGEDGKYDVGRHGTGLSAPLDPDVLVLWAGYSHLDALMPRRLQIQTRIPARDRAMGWGYHHLATVAEIEAAWAACVGQSYALDAVYARYLGAEATAA